jgi:hypothetical protein
MVTTNGLARGATQQVSFRYRNLKPGLWLGSGVQALKDDLSTQYGVNLSAQTTFTISGKSPEQVRAATQSLKRQLKTPAMKDNHQLQVEA